MRTGEGGGLAQPEPWGGFQELRRAEGTVTVKAWCDEEKEEVEMTEVRKLSVAFSHSDYHIFMHWRKAAE